jgi:aryl-phospho-beta-D-glucosidase BglC (GH1 family)
VHSQFIQVSGEDFVLDGQKIVFRGFGIGNWMNMEHFMTKMPGTDHQKKMAFQEIYGAENTREFFESYLANYITEKDIAFLKDLGVNAIRLPFTYRHFEDDQHPGEYREEGFRHLDRVLKYCDKYRIYAILDLHAVPGGQNPDTHADNDIGESKFWDEASFRNRVIGLWSFIAGHYKDHRWIAGYDLVNEPVNVPNGEVFNDFYDKTVEAIRKVDPYHVLFIEGDHWAQDFSMLHEPSDPQIAVSIHYYPWFSMNKNYQERWDKKDIERDLKSLFQIRDRFHRPVWCGETGSGFSKERILYNRDLLKDTLDILEENDVSWTIWAYKDAQAMGLMFPKSDSLWMKFVAEMNWQHFRDMEFVYRVFDFLEESRHFEPIAEKLRGRLRFRIQGVFQCLYVEQILKPMLSNTPWTEIRNIPASFHRDNCEYYPEIADLIKSYTLK